MHPRLPSDSCIALLRHGDYEQPSDVPSAHLPHPLTEEGSVQAGAAAQDLIDLSRESGLYIDNVLDTSAQLRAWETGDIICKALAGEFGASFDIREVENLAERCLGSVANLRVSQIEEILERDPRYQRPQPGWKSRSWYRLPFQGAESLMESGIRVASHLQHCADELEVGPKRIKVIVGHGASLRHAALCLGMLKPTDIPKLSMHHAKPIFVQRQVMGQWKKLFGEWKLRASKEEIRD